MIAGALATAMTAGLFGVSGFVVPQVTTEAAELPVRETTTTTVGENKIIIGVEGMDYTSAQEEILKRINEERKEACDNGYIDPRDTTRKRKLQPSDYVEMKLGAACLEAAKTRAAEGALYLAHVRPDGTSCNSALLYYLGSSGGYGENLAWNSKSSSAYEQWINDGNTPEKTNWIEQNDKEAGHYTNLINPNNKYAGTATFNPTNDALSWACTAGEYSSKDTEVTTLPGKKSEALIQKMVVPVSAVTSMDISVGSQLLNVGDSANAELLVSVTFNTLRTNTVTDCPVYNGITWSSSDKSVLQVAEDGKITAVGMGEATLTAVIGSGTSAQQVERKILVVPEGTTVTGVEDPEMVYAETNHTPQLSKTVKATLSNGDTVDVDATWEAYDTSLLLTHFTSREFDVAGDAFGFTVTQKVHINAAKILRSYTSADELITDSGTLPDDVTVYVGLSNGYAWMYSSKWQTPGYYNVYWDQDSVAQYKKREGGDVVFTGYIVLTTDDGQIHYPIEQKVHVNPATVTDVAFTQTEVTTDSGSVPDYPKATVTWSNGDVTEEEIEWANADPTTADRKYMKREGGDYTLTGTYNEQETTITVHVNPATPVTATIPVKERTKTVPSGTPAALVEEASISWSNGDTTTSSITWEEQKHDDYAKIDGGDYTVKGSAEGLEVTVTVTVLPATIKSVEQLNQIETVQKKKPVLPETVHVEWSNEDETDVEVAWDTVPASEYAEPNVDFSVNGYITDFNGDKTKVTVTVHVNERELESIAWETGSPSSYTSYYGYKKSDFAGTLIATYDNGETETVDVTEAMITGFDADSKDSTQTIVVSYTVAGVTKTIEADMNLIQRTGIFVSKLPKKLKYIEGESLDLTGIEVSETLDNETSRVLPEEESGKLFYIDQIQAPPAYGDQEVSVNLGTFKTTFTINVRKKQLKEMDLWGLPKKLVYAQGQPLDMAGLGVKAVYDNGDVKELTVTPDMLRIDLELTEENISKGDFGRQADTDTVGENRVYVLYSEPFEENGMTGTHYVAAYFTIEIQEKVVQSVEFETAPSRTEYPEGDITFDDFSDAVLLVHNNCDFDETVPITEADITDFDIDTIGTYEVKVTYGGKFLTFDAIVRAKQVSEIYAVAPKRLQYLVGETMDLAGGEVVVAYDNGTADHYPLTEANEKLTVAFADGTGLSDTLTKGVKTLDVTWDGTTVATKTGGSIQVDVVDKKLKSIAWKGGKPDTDTSYYNYDKSDLTGTLVVTYENADPDEVELTPDMITVFDGDSQKSSQMVTITYTLATQKVTMNTEMKLVKRCGIEVTGVPGKTVYIEGESLDPTGIRISEILDNGEKRPLSDAEIESAVYTGFVSRPTKYGAQRVTVKAGGFENTFTVTVKQRTLDGICLINAPDKLSYVETQPIDLTGLVVEAGYDNGDKETITVTKDMLREGVKVTGTGDDTRLDTGIAANTDTVGTHTVYVLYSEEDPEEAGTIHYAYVSFDIEVIEKVVQSIEFLTDPEVTEYPEGDVNFDCFGGLKLLVHCNGDYDEIVEVTADEISGFDLDTVGEQEVTISYGGKELTFPAKVREKKATETIVTAPTKTSYEPGEALDLTGAYIIVTYDNGRTEKIPVTEENEDITVSFVGGGSDASMTEGSKQLVITYKGQTLEVQGGKPVTIVVEKKNDPAQGSGQGSGQGTKTDPGQKTGKPVKTKYRSEWRKGIWYDKNGYATKYKMKWKHDKKGWWIVDNSGWYPKKQWQKIDGKWYYFKANGYMASAEWCKGYWLDKSGAWTYKLKAGWHKDGTGWWFGNKKWYAKKQWQKIDGKWYYFDAKGYMVTDQYVEGYYVGADGVCR